MTVRDTTSFYKNILLEVQIKYYSREEIIILLHIIVENYSLLRILVVPRLLWLFEIIVGLQDWRASLPFFSSPTNMSLCSLTFLWAELHVIFHVATNRSVKLTPIVNFDWSWLLRGKDCHSRQSRATCVNCCLRLVISSRVINSTIWCLVHALVCGDVMICEVLDKILIHKILEIKIHKYYYNVLHYILNSLPIG